MIVTRAPNTRLMTYNIPMRDWNLKEVSRLPIALASDARQTVPDYCDDQIWELAFAEGEPPALSLRTTYGLRARLMRLFPRFTEKDQGVSDPRQFVSPPTLHQFFPNYALLTSSPFPGIDVVHEYWVPENYTVAGRLRITNSGVTPRNIRLEWIALLNSGAEGEPMTPKKIQGVTVLQGQTGNLAPVIFSVGGLEASSSPYPALVLDLDLLPGTLRTFTWVHVARPEAEASFELARQIATRNWEAATARIELTNESQLAIETGDPEWDLAFALGQNAALGLIHGPTEHLPHASFVLSRRSDQGYSLREDGRDYDYLWSGQTSIDTWYLAGILLPATPDYVKGMLKNFLFTQADLGYADWKLGMAGQRSRLDATPILATLAWEIYQHTEDRAFVQEIFAELLTFILAWFGPYHDRDGDSVPEWDHPRQSGFEDHPLFSHYHAWSHRVDITTTESPALCAFLFRECQSMIHLAEIVDRPETIKPLRAMADILRSAVAESWDPQAAIYRYRDRDTHRSPAGETITDVHGAGTKRRRRKFPAPQRLLVEVQTEQQHGTGRLGLGNGRVTVSGKDKLGNPYEESFTSEKFTRFMSFATATTEGTFSSVTRLKVEGVDAKDRVRLMSVDYTLEDHSLLLPLWAAIPDSKIAKEIVSRTLRDAQRFHRPFGVPACSRTAAVEHEGHLGAVWLTWNTMIAEGLLRYGFREEAADLFTRFMTAINQNLRKEGAFRSYYDSDTGEGIGEQNTLMGLPPLGLFLKILGVRLVSAWRVALDGKNPFPWPVKVKYRGLTVHRGVDETRITFPNGQSVDIQSPKACIVDGKSNK